MAERENRIKNTSVATGTGDSSSSSVSTPAVSPTGEPLIPPKYNKYIVAGFAALGGLAAAPTLGLSLIPIGVANAALLICVVLGPVFGISSAGIRKSPQP